MNLLGLLMPLLAGAGWLWWIYETDHFEREPWPLVLKTAGVGMATGLVSFIISAIVWEALAPAGVAAQALAETGLHLVGIVVPMYLLPFRNQNWNEPFDGLVYGGAVGIGYGLIYTLPGLLGGPEVGYRIAIFSIPIFMLAGIIIGRYMSKVRFGPRSGRVAAWVRGLWVTGLFLYGIDLALAFGAEVVSGRNMLAGLLAYGANMAAWLIATRAMDESHRLSPFNGAAYELQLAPAACSQCGSSYPVGASYCSGCGTILRPQGEVHP